MTCLEAEINHDSVPQGRSAPGSARMTARMPRGGSQSANNTPRMTSQSPQWSAASLGSASAASLGSAWVSRQSSQESSHGAQIRGISHASSFDSNILNASPSKQRGHAGSDGGHHQFQAEIDRMKGECQKVVSEKEAEAVSRLIASQSLPRAHAVCLWLVSIS